MMLRDMAQPLAFDSSSPGLVSSPLRESMTEDVAHVALHDDREAIVQDAVETARDATGSDSAFAAARDTDGSAYPIEELTGIAEPGFRGLVIRPGRGLGGQVLAERRPRTVDDYLAESS